VSVQPRPAAAELVGGRFKSVVEDSPPGERRLRVPVAVIDRAAALLAEEGARFVGLHVVEEPERSLLVVFAFRGELVSLRAPLPADKPVFASLAGAVPAARLDEAVASEAFGVRVLGEPSAARVLQPDADRPPRKVVGPEAFVIPYGPIRSGIFETVQHVVDTGGEDVLALTVRPFFKRRGLEARIEGVTPREGSYVTARVAGIASVAHGIAFANAVERALGVQAPPRAQLLRVVHAELERIANHLDVAVKLAEDAALSVGLARFAILKEDVLRLRAATCGSRFGRDVVVPGGVSAPCAIPNAEIAAALARLERDLRRDRRLLLRTTGFVDRLIGSGRLDRGTIDRLAAVGPVARAAGVSTDARFERPYDAYARLGFDVVTRDKGDAMARLEVRLGEVDQSLHLIRQALDRIEREPPELLAPLPDEAGEAFGWSEAPMGELVYHVRLAGGRLHDVRISSPSLRNWAPLEESFRGDVLTDFSFIEHSFGLTPAGSDR
jgi:Ni,Fe-hydrogenase III large subunit/Ni,Fe-hydrogenase III component G